MINSGEDIPSAVDYKTYIKAAAALERLGLLSEAELAYRAIPSRWEETVEYYLAMGNLSLASQRYLKAEDYFKKAQALKPDSVLILNNLAWTLAKLNYCDSALVVAQRALRLDRGECGAACLSTMEFVKSSACKFKQLED